MTDINGNPIYRQPDIGAYEYQPTVQRAPLQYPGRVPYHFEVVSGDSWANYVIKAPVCAELIAADDGTFYTAGVPNNIDATARAGMTGDQFFFSTKRGLTIYDSALTGNDLAKVDRYHGF